MNQRESKSWTLLCALLYIIHTQTGQIVFLTVVDKSIDKSSSVRSFFRIVYFISKKSKIKIKWFFFALWFENHGLQTLKSSTQILAICVENAGGSIQRLFSCIPSNCQIFLKTFRWLWKTLLRFSVCTIYYYVHCSLLSKQPYQIASLLR